MTTLFEKIKNSLGKQEILNFEDINLEGLVESKGILYVWTNKSIKSRELEINVREELGVKQQLVNKAEIHDLEPHIKPIYHAGVYYPYARHARNPKKILLKLFDLFLRKGGKFNNNAFQNMMDQNIKISKMKERMRKKAEQNKNNNNNEHRTKKKKVKNN